MRGRLLLLVLLITASGGACSGAGSPPPPPLRPTPDDRADAGRPTDCQPVEPGSEDPRKTFGQRSIAEAEMLSQAAVGTLQSAENPDMDAGERVALIGAAVDQLITALLADPYNVNATYNLAAAYARIERPQCAINLLERMILMRDHPSRAHEVSAKLDRLLGRTQSLDPDFNAMRGDARFRRMIEKMCEGSSDAACVLGR
jgi:hypothetical protein